MKKMKRCILMALFLAMFATKLVYAEEIKWENLPGHHGQSVLLPAEETKSKDTIGNVARGKYLSTAILEIQNNQDGTLHVGVDTLAHVYVDRIYQVVFLDIWDEEKGDWNQIAEWKFERTKEEEADLSSYYVGFTVTDCPVNRYYRARAMHLVEVGDLMEGKATKTEGVLLTDHEV